LDDNPDEPLVFEEQFILRVPREVAEEKGLGEMVRGKGKGLEGVEFKFLGEWMCECDYEVLIEGGLQIRDGRCSK
jgi:hypothetical protein